MLNEEMSHICPVNNCRWYICKSCSHSVLPPLLRRRRICQRDSLHLKSPRKLALQIEFITKLSLALLDYVFRRTAALFGALTFFHFGTEQGRGSVIKNPVVYINVGICLDLIKYWPNTCLNVESSVIWSNNRYTKNYWGKLKKMGLMSKFCIKRMKIQYIGQFPNLVYYPDCILANTNYPDCLCARMDSYCIPILSFPTFLCG